jgi:aminopeptidase YwaD
MKAFLFNFKFFFLTSLTFTLFVNSNGTCQQIDGNSTFQLIKNLSSDSFYGRSVFKSGKDSAANFIKAYITTHSTQDLTIKEDISDTTFNQIDSVLIKINGKQILPGAQYLPSGSSPSIKTTQTIISLTNNDFLKENIPSLISKDLKDKIVLLKYESAISSNHSISLQDKISVLRYFGSQLIFIETNQLLYSPSTFQDHIPIIWILPGLLTNSSSVSISIKSSIKPYTVRNIIITPNLISNSSAITLMAHYDHLGSFGKAYIFNGANDNASGVSVAINLFLTLLTKSNQIQLILTDGEELGLIGSKKLQERGNHHPISFLVNLDMLGSATKGLATVGFNASDSLKKQLVYYCDSLLIPIKFRPNSPNSDQYYFLQNGITGFYMYSNEGKQPYHNLNDDYQTLDYDFLIQTQHLLFQFLLYLTF